MSSEAPDALELFEQYEAEQERMERRCHKEEIAWEMADWEQEA